MYRWLLLPLALGAACGPPDNIGVNGWQMHNFFPFDGTRSWEFTSTDTSLVHRLVASYDGEPTILDDGTRAYEVRYDLVCVDPDDETCSDEWVRSLIWSAASGAGVKLHELHAPDGDVTFDPALVVASGEMFAGDAVTTGAWTSTFVAIEPCPVLWTEEWDRCAHLTIEGGEGVAVDHLVGDYWAVASFNVVSIGLTAESGDWQLSYATFEL